MYIWKLYAINSKQSLQSRRKFIIICFQYYPRRNLKVFSKCSYIKKRTTKIKVVRDEHQNKTSQRLKKKTIKQQYIKINNRLLNNADNLGLSIVFIVLAFEIDNIVRFSLVLLALFNIYLVQVVEPALAFQFPCKLDTVL